MILYSSSIKFSFRLHPSCLPPSCRRGIVIFCKKKTTNNTRTITTINNNQKMLLTFAVGNPCNDQNYNMIHELCVMFLYYRRVRYGTLGECSTRGCLLGYDNLSWRNLMKMILYVSTRISFFEWSFCDYGPRISRIVFNTKPGCWTQFYEWQFFCLNPKHKTTWHNEAQILKIAVEEYY
jgi:hypothetical protein